MAITLEQPTVPRLDAALAALREWQSDEAPMQLHPGDLGWFWRNGPAATAAAVRIWNRGDRVVAVGLLDGTNLLRVTAAPDQLRDEELADRIVADLADPARGVLAAGKAILEAPLVALLQDRLLEAGWVADEEWAPHRLDLADPVPEPGLRIGIAGPQLAPVRVAIHRASFEVSTFTPQSWQDMAAGPQYADARCLVGYDAQDRAVAATTVWSAGAGRPGLIEPLGVHRDHRGHGHGREITVAAAAVLRALGSSSMIVCTPGSNAAGVGAYRSAGMRPFSRARDLRRDG
ncbi:MAG TPA: GNAT family N-acetyltransferase [Microlunatus sp.]|nr:GNAT family N-acetyltransferase [Microlunatus sp.]